MLLSQQPEPTLNQQKDNFKSFMQRDNITHEAAWAELYKIIQAYCNEVLGLLLNESDVTDASQSALQPAGEKRTELHTIQHDLRLSLEEIKTKFYPGLRQPQEVKLLFSKLQSLTDVSQVDLESANIDFSIEKHVLGALRKVYDTVISRDFQINGLNKRDLLASFRPALDAVSQSLTEATIELGQQLSNSTESNVVPLAIISNPTPQDSQNEILTQLNVEFHTLYDNFAFVRETQPQKPLLSRIRRGITDFNTTIQLIQPGFEPNTIHGKILAFNAIMKEPKADKNQAWGLLFELMKRYVEESAQFINQIVYDDNFQNYEPYKRLDGYTQLKHFIKNTLNKAEPGSSLNYLGVRLNNLLEAPLSPRSKDFPTSSPLVAENNCIIELNIFLKFCKTLKSQEKDFLHIVQPLVKTILAKVEEERMRLEKVAQIGTPTDTRAYQEIINFEKKIVLLEEKPYPSKGSISRSWVTLVNELGKKNTSEVKIVSDNVNRQSRINGFKQHIRGTDADVKKAEGLVESTLTMLFRNINVLLHKRNYISAKGVEGMGYRQMPSYNLYADSTDVIEFFTAIDQYCVDNNLAEREFITGLKDRIVAFANGIPEIDDTAGELEKYIIDSIKNIYDFSNQTPKNGRLFAGNNQLLLVMKPLLQTCIEKLEDLKQFQRPLNTGIGGIGSVNIDQIIKDARVLEKAMEQAILSPSLSFTKPRGNNKTTITPTPSLTVGRPPSALPPQPPLIIPAPQPPAPASAQPPAPIIPAVLPVTTTTAAIQLGGAGVKEPTIILDKGIDILQGTLRGAMHELAVNLNMYIQVISVYSLQSDADTSGKVKMTNNANSLMDKINSSLLMKEFKRQLDELRVNNNLSPEMKKIQYYLDEIARLCNSLSDLRDSVVALNNASFQDSEGQKNLFVRRLEENAHKIWTKMHDMENDPGLKDFYDRNLDHKGIAALFYNTIKSALVESYKNQTTPDGHNNQIQAMERKFNSGAETQTLLQRVINANENFNKYLLLLRENVRNPDKAAEREFYKEQLKAASNEFNDARRQIIKELKSNFKESQAMKDLEAKYHLAKEELINNRHAENKKLKDRIDASENELRLVDMQKTNDINALYEAAVKNADDDATHKISILHAGAAAEKFIIEGNTNLDNKQKDAQVHRVNIESEKAIQDVNDKLAALKINALRDKNTALQDNEATLAKKRENININVDTEQNRLTAELQQKDNALANQFEAEKEKLEKESNDRKSFTRNVIAFLPEFPLEMLRSNTNSLDPNLFNDNSNPDLTEEDLSSANIGDNYFEFKAHAYKTSMPSVQAAVVSYPELGCNIEELESLFINEKHFIEVIVGKNLAQPVVFDKDEENALNARIQQLKDGAQRYKSKVVEEVLIPQKLQDNTTKLIASLVDSTASLASRQNLIAEIKQQLNDARQKIAGLQATAENKISFASADDENTTRQIIIQASKSVSLINLLVQSGTKPLHDPSVQENMEVIIVASQKLNEASAAINESKKHLKQAAGNLNKQTGVQFEKARTQLEQEYDKRRKSIDNGISLSSALNLGLRDKLRDMNNNNPYHYNPERSLKIALINYAEKVEQALQNAVYDKTSNTLDKKELSYIKALESYNLPIIASHLEKMLKEKNKMRPFYSNFFAALIELEALLRHPHLEPGHLANDLTMQIKKLYDLIEVETKALNGADPFTDIGLTKTELLQILRPVVVASKLHLKTLLGNSVIGNTAQAQSLSGCLKQVETLEEFIPPKKPLLLRFFITIALPIRFLLFSIITSYKRLQSRSVQASIQKQMSPSLPANPVSVSSVTPSVTSNKPLKLQNSSRMAIQDKNGNIASVWTISASEPITVLPIKTEEGGPILIAYQSADTLNGAKYNKIKTLGKKTIVYDLSGNPPDNSTREEIMIKGNKYEFFMQLDSSGTQIITLGKEILSSLILCQYFIAHMSNRKFLEGNIIIAGGKPEQSIEVAALIGCRVNAVVPGHPTYASMRNGNEFIKNIDKVTRAMYVSPPIVSSQEVALQRQRFQEGHDLIVTINREYNARKMLIPGEKEFYSDYQIQRMNTVYTVEQTWRAKKKEALQVKQQTWQNYRGEDLTLAKQAFDASWAAQFEIMKTKALKDLKNQKSKEWNQNYKIPYDIALNKRASSNYHRIDVHNMQQDSVSSSLLQNLQQRHIYAPLINEFIVPLRNGLNVAKTSSNLTDLTNFQNNLVGMRDEIKRCASVYGGEKSFESRYGNIPVYQDFFASYNKLDVTDKRLCLKEMASTLGGWVDNHLTQGQVLTNPSR